MDNIQSSDAKLSLDNAPAGMAPMEEPTSTTEMPSESSGETPQNDAVGVEENETPTEGQSQEPKEELIAGKFKSQDDLVNAYKELESHNKKVEMERSDLEKLFVENETDSTKVDNAPTETVENVSTDIKTALDDMRPTLAAEVSKMLAKPLAKLEVQDMLNKHGNAFTQKAKEVKELQQHNPSLSMEDAFKIVSFDTVKRTSHTQGINEASANAEAKKKAEVETARPSGYRPTSIEDAIKDPNVSVSEIADAVGPEMDAFKRISQQKIRQMGRGA